MEAGDIAMSELAMEIVNTPADTMLNLSSTYVIEDVMVRSHESASALDDFDMVMPSMDKVRSVASSMTRIYFALEQTLVRTLPYHVFGENLHSFFESKRVSKVAELCRAGT